MTTPPPHPHPHTQIIWSCLCLSILATTSGLWTPDLCVLTAHYMTTHPITPPATYPNNVVLPLPEYPRHHQWPVDTKPVRAHRPLAEQHDEHVVPQGVFGGSLSEGEAVIEGGERVEGPAGQEGVSVQHLKQLQDLLDVGTCELVGGG